MLSRGTKFESLKQVQYHKMKSENSREALFHGTKFESWREALCHVTKSESLVGKPFGEMKCLSLTFLNACSY